MKPGTYSAVVPVRVVHYSPEQRERWCQMWRGWIASGRTDWSVWKEFEPLARSGRTIFANKKNPPTRHHHFAETLVAYQLEQEGYTTWGGGVCAIARSAGMMERHRKQTAIVRELLEDDGLPCPTDFKDRLSFHLRQPDITAFHPKRKEWRFSEVKLDGDRLDAEGNQLTTLGFLQALLRAHVEVVRVLPEGTQVKQRAFTCSYTLS